MELLDVNVKETCEEIEEIQEEEVVFTEEESALAREFYGYLGNLAMFLQSGKIEGTKEKLLLEKLDINDRFLKELQMSIFKIQCL